VAQPDVEIPSGAYGVALPLASVGGFVDFVGFLTLAGSASSPAVHSVRCSRCAGTYGHSRCRSAG
jgi:hypothetical protein